MQAMPARAVSAEAASCGVIKTDDGGNTWTRLAGISLTQNDYLESVFTFGPPTPSYCQGTYDNALTVSPTNENVIMAGGIALIRPVEAVKIGTRLDRDDRGESVYTKTITRWSIKAGTPCSTGATAGCSRSRLTVA